MFIDPHVHCRDGKQAYKETIAHALHVAEQAGFSAIFDMPNKDPPIYDFEAAQGQIAIAGTKSPVFYGIHLGLTAHPEQIKRAVEAYHALFPRVVGFKLYAGHSVGNLGVVDLDEQKGVYRTLAKEGYSGVLVVHCEKESCMSKDWNTQYPVTHAFARPPKAEVESLRDQIFLAKEYKFQGTLHVAHISVPEAVELVAGNRDLKMTCGVTPHHLLFDYTAMEKEDGLLLKMNPPLRPPGYNSKLLEQLKDGKITWVETDHAPHTLEEKVSMDAKKFMSGIPGLQIYPSFVHWLRSRNVTRERLSEITFDSIRAAYGLEKHLEKRICTPRHGLEGEYPFDPYRGSALGKQE